MASRFTASCHKCLNKHFDNTGNPRTSRTPAHLGFPLFFAMCHAKPSLKGPGTSPVESMTANMYMSRRAMPLYTTSWLDPTPARLCTTSRSAQANFHTSAGTSSNSGDVLLGAPRITRAIAWYSPSASTTSFASGGSNGTVDGARHSTGAANIPPAGPSCARCASHSGTVGALAHKGMRIRPRGPAPTPAMRRANRQHFDMARCRSAAANSCTSTSIRWRARARANTRNRL